VIVWDNASAHKAVQREGGFRFSFINTPPYTPEVNPAEALWRVIRQELANKVFNSLDEFEEELIKIPQPFILGMWMVLNSTKKDGDLPPSFLVIFNA
ncbi:MAG: hypothetical protein GXO39_02245, partial [Thermotogae bacterium]|nr:hypothetical protein [Thermotogota bacterium]